MNGPSAIATMKRSLRRTLVRSYRYAATKQQMM